MNASPPVAADISADRLADRAGLLRRIAADGFAFLPGADMVRLTGPVPDWDAFAASWDELRLDEYMADGGRYRRRRHAVFSLGEDGHWQRELHQPHYQARDYNPLNGGVARWFEPVDEAIGAGASLRTILRGCHDLFGALAGAPRRWRVEVHQFRIEAAAGQAGLPTPEGSHRDGVDYVLALMVRRVNIASGTTTIHAPDGRSLGAFTLTGPLDAAFVDDARVFHGVTPVQPVDPAQPAFRDVLVVTFRAYNAASPP